MKSKFTLRKKCLEKRDTFFKKKGSDCLKLKDIKAIILEIKSKFKKKIITAINVSSKDDVIKYKDYTEISDIILFDSKGYHKSESFDHNLLNDVAKKINKMIAGNIQIDDIPSFKNKDFIIDLSGALEDEKGKKDINRINKLLDLSSKIRKKKKEYH